jgi:hypothetical protein
MGETVEQFAYTIDISLTVDSWAELADHLGAALEGFAWPAVEGVRAPAPVARPKRMAAPGAPLGPLVAKLDSTVGTADDAVFYFAGASRLHVTRNNGKYGLLLWLNPNDSIFDDPVDCVRVLTHVARGLLARRAVENVSAHRQGSGACVPLVPLAGTRRPLVLATDREVEQAYERPEEFWSAGWKVERFGERALLTRCQDVITRGEIFRETRDHQWQMARAAMPGLTKFGYPRVADDEKDWFEDGQPRLEPVGQNEAGLVEYACTLERGDHLQGFEIFYLWELVERKQFRDGKPLTAVRVVFLEEWMAVNEKRPLLDIGVQVFYEDSETGELVEFAE